MVSPLSPEALAAVFSDSGDSDDDLPPQMLESDSDDPRLAMLASVIDRSDSDDSDVFSVSTIPTYIYMSIPRVPYCLTMIFTSHACNLVDEVPHKEASVH